MSVNFSFDEKNISVILDETNLQINNLEQNVQVNLENQFKIEDLSDKTLVKILMLKGEKGDTGATTGASWGYITGNITDQTDLKNALNSKVNANELSTVATSGSYNDLTNKPTIPSKTSDLTNDSGFIDNSYHDNTKQDTLVSGTNIKTINNTSLLGSGNITIEGGGGSATDVQINGTSITSNDVANIVTEGTYNASTNKIATKSDIPTKTSDLINDSGFAKIFYVDTETTTYTYSQISGLIADGYEIRLISNDYTNNEILNMVDYDAHYMYFTTIDQELSISYAYYFENNLWEEDTKYLALETSIPTKVSDLTNDSGFITSYTETDPVFTSSVAHGITSTDITNWNNKSTFSGSYNDLTNKPTIPDELSDLSDDSTHRLVTDTEKSTWNAKSDFSGSYNDLTNKPTIPTKTSDLTNDSNFVSDASYVHTDNNYTSSEKTKLSGIETGAEVNDIDAIKVNGTTQTITNKAVDITIPTKTSDLENDGTDIVDEERYAITVRTLNNAQVPAGNGIYVDYDGYNDPVVQPIFDYEILDDYSLAFQSDIPTSTSDLLNDSGFIDSSYHDSTKQDTLVSGTNIKTINNTSILGSGDISIGSGLTFDDIYPIGSIYMSVNNTSPSTLFGGTWVQIKDTFLLSAGDTYTAGDTGGSATHTLTVDEMPSHKHRLGVPNTTASTMGYPVNQSGNTKFAFNGGSALMEETGGGQAHNNMPPYLAVYMWKRTA